MLIFGPNTLVDCMPYHVSAGILRELVGPITLHGGSTEYYESTHGLISDYVFIPWAQLQEAMISPNAHSFLASDARADRTGHV